MILVKIDSLVTYIGEWNGPLIRFSTRIAGHWNIVERTMARRLVHTHIVISMRQNDRYSLCDQLFAYRSAECTRYLCEIKLCQFATRTRFRILKKYSSYDISWPSMGFHHDNNITPVVIARYSAYGQTSTYGNALGFLLIPESDFQIMSFNLGLFFKISSFVSYQICLYVYRSIVCSYIYAIFLFSFFLFIERATTKFE